MTDRTQQLRRRNKEMSAQQIECALANLPRQIRAEWQVALDQSEAHVDPDGTGWLSRKDSGTSIALAGRVTLMTCDSGGPLYVFRNGREVGGVLTGLLEELEWELAKLDVDLRFVLEDRDQ